jgi:hypothetical protein
MKKIANFITFLMAKNEVLFDHQKIIEKNFEGLLEF